MNVSNVKFWAGDILLDNALLMGKTIVVDNDQIKTIIRIIYVI